VWSRLKTSVQPWDKRKVFLSSRNFSVSTLIVLFALRRLRCVTSHSIRATKNSLVRYAVISSLTYLLNFALIVSRLSVFLFHSHCFINYMIDYMWCYFLLAVDRKCWKILQNVESGHPGCKYFHTLCTCCCCCLIVCGCQYRCNWLPGKTRLQNDVLCIEWDIKPYTLTQVIKDLHLCEVITWCLDTLAESPSLIRGCCCCCYPCLCYCINYLLVSDSLHQRLDHAVKLSVTCLMYLTCLMSSRLQFLTLSSHLCFLQRTAKQVLYVYMYGGISVMSVRLSLRYCVKTRKYRGMPSSP